MKITTSRFVRDLKVFATAHQRQAPYAVVAVICLSIYALSKGRDTVREVYRSDKQVEFKDSRILGTQSDSLLEGKERLLFKTVRDLQTGQAELKDLIEKMKLNPTVAPRAQPSPTDPSPLPTGASVSAALLPTTSKAGETPRIHPTEERLTTSGTSDHRSRRGEIGLSGRQRQWGGSSAEEASIISFPVRDNPVEKVDAVTIPSGSYVKAKLMTGIEAPEGKTYPVLLQLDFAYIAPNRHRVDLSGCFMIAKSQGDLSTERVQMQATKLSCVSKDGKMFEREVNGFIADDKDNSFAVIGSVNSKQDRVAAMAFLSSVVEGVGKAVQQAQTTSQTNALGGSQSIVTGDQAKYLAAGGASSAGSMIAQWYLKQAQNLLPDHRLRARRLVVMQIIRLPPNTFGGGHPGQFLLIAGPGNRRASHNLGITIPLSKPTQPKGQP